MIRSLADRGTTLPWGLVRDAITVSAAIRWLRLAAGSSSVDCAYEAAGTLMLERPDESERYSVKPDAGGAILEVDQIQDLADLASRLLEAIAGAELRFHVRVVLDGDHSPDERDAVELRCSSRLTRCGTTLRSLGPKGPPRTIMLGLCLISIVAFMGHQSGRKIRKGIGVYQRNFLCQGVDCCL